MNNKIIPLSTLFVSRLLCDQSDIYEKSLKELLSTKSELKTDIGSRGGAKNYLESNTPIDVITYQQIEHSGLTSLVDVLRYFVAGFNAPETSVADGSDHVRSFTIRGMSPDQVLVLINGKRVHTSALLHVNGVIGRGSSHVDLDTISIASIERIEIMRDGASAQYGSDAISGVINIILKGMGHKNSISGQYGKRSRGDGVQEQASSFISIPLEYDGFFNITMEAIKQEATQRAGKDRRVMPPRVLTHVGVPDSVNYKAVINSEIVQTDNINIYTNAILNYRDSKASAFYRPPNSDVANSNGFLPIINAKILDYGLCAGVKGKFSKDTSWDLSNSYGVNLFHYYVNDSINYTLGNSSPNSFDNGSLKFTQNTTNFDIVKHLKDLKISSGLEYRYETYKIQAGDKASYTNNKDIKKIAGSQGFAGFTQGNEVDRHRDSLAFYMDSVADINKKLTVEVFARYEEYSDFGESTNAKMAVSYKIMNNLLFRTSGSTGFRAPSLAQSFYAQTSSFVDEKGILTHQGTFRTDHEVSRAFGAQNLLSERSKNFSIGGVYEPTKKLSFMLDFFYIDVHNRILLTNNLSGSTKEQKALLLKYGVSQIRYFANAAITNTRGLDLKMNYSYEFENSSILEVNSWLNYTQNTINNKDTNTQNDVEKVRIENGQPKDSLRLLATYTQKDLEYVLNMSRYGAYSQMLNGTVYDFDASWTTDVQVSFQATKDAKLSIGGNNIFDSVPNKWRGDVNNFYGNNGIKPYSRYSPYGYSGAYYYIKATLEF